MELVLIVGGCLAFGLGLAKFIQFLVDLIDPDGRWIWDRED